MLHLLQSFQNDLPVAFKHLKLGLVLDPAVRNHSHQVEADVVVRLTGGGGDDGDKRKRVRRCLWVKALRSTEMQDKRAIIFLIKD